MKTKLSLGKEKHLNTSDKYKVLLSFTRFILLSTAFEKTSEERIGLVTPFRFLRNQHNKNINEDDEEFL